MWLIQNCQRWIVFTFRWSEISAALPHPCCVLESFLFLDFQVFTANSSAPAPTWPFDEYNGNVIPGCLMAVTITIKTLEAQKFLKRNDNPLPLHGVPVSHRQGKMDERCLKCFCLPLDAVMSRSNTN